MLGLALYAELAARRGFAPPGRRTALALAALMFFLTIGRYADVTAPALYGRPVNLYWDARHLPNVGAMLVEVAKPWMLAVFLAALVAFVAVIGGALYWALARVERSLHDARARRALGVLGAALVAAFFVGRALDWPVSYWFSSPVLATYRDQVEFVLEAHSDAAQRALPDRPLAPSDLRRVQGADVLLMFLESYGAVTYDSAAIAAIVADGRRELASAADATHRDVSSAFVESPTFGGSSWLAHSTLLTGLDVREPATYDLLLTQQRPTLPKRFASLGFRALAVMPGLKNDWPEGAFYGFDAILGERELDYAGPEFGWWRIPDQYSLAKLDSIALEPGAALPGLRVLSDDQHAHPVPADAAVSTGLAARARTPPVRRRRGGSERRAVSRLDQPRCAVRRVVRVHAAISRRLLTRPPRCGHRSRADRRSSACGGRHRRRRALGRAGARDHAPRRRDSCAARSGVRRGIGLDRDVSPRRRHGRPYDAPAHAHSTRTASRRARRARRRAPTECGLKGALRPRARAGYVAKSERRRRRPTAHRAATSR